jgi:hypothetical protein
MPRSAKGFPARLIPLLLLSGATAAQGSLWESGNWALTGTLNAVAGYDSNPTAGHDGRGDAFAQANPVLTLARRNSSTECTLDCGATTTNFASGRLPARTDLRFDALYAYPNADNVIPLYGADASWLRSSQPNAYLGGRILTEQLTFNAEGYQPVTGKLGVRGSVNFTGENFDSAALNASRHGAASVGLAYEHDPRTEFSVNIGAALGQSRPNDPQRVSADVRSTEYYFTGRLRGELCAKISGNLFAGLGAARYTGGYLHRTTLPVGGAEVTWTISPIRKLMLSGATGPSFAPDGLSGQISRVVLTFTQQIVGRWQYALHAGPVHSVYSREIRERTDDTWDVGMEFAYQPSERFRVALNLNCTNQNSSRTSAQFDRNVVSLGAAFRL